MLLTLDLGNTEITYREHRCGVCLGHLEGEPDPGLPLCERCGLAAMELAQAIRERADARLRGLAVWTLGLAGGRAH